MAPFLVRIHDQDPRPDASRGWHGDSRLPEPHDVSECVESVSPDAHPHDLGVGRGQPQRVMTCRTVVHGQIGLDDSCSQVARERPQMRIAPCEGAIGKDDIEPNTRLVLGQHLQVSCWAEAVGLVGPGNIEGEDLEGCLLYTSPSPRD